MANIEALKALSRIREEKNNTNSININPIVSNYNINEVNNQLLSIQQEPIKKSVNESISQNLLSNIGKALFSGGYEAVESAGFSIPGLIEAGLKKYTDLPIEKYGPQATARRFQEESTLSKVTGGVGTGVGFMVGAPVKLTSALLSKAVIKPAAYLFQKKSLNTAISEASKLSAKGIDKKVVNEFTNKLTQSTQRAFAETASITGTKSKVINQVFEKSFTSDINRIISKGIANGTINRAQATTIRSMAATVGSKGVPIQTLQNLAFSKYGNTAIGRFASEALHDAFIFSVADAVMSVSEQGQRMLNDPTGKTKFSFGEVGIQAATGLLAGTAVNAFTAPFKPMSKMMYSRSDFIDGIKGYLGKNNYKGKDLNYLTKQMIKTAEDNKINGKSTRIKYTKDDKITKIKSKGYIDLDAYSVSSGGNIKLAERSIKRRLKAAFGDNAENKSINWLMKQRKEYSKDIIREASRETFANYKNLFWRSALAGTAMGGTQAIMASVDGQELQGEDFISSFIIGGWTQRRGPFGKVDIGTKINKLRNGLENLGIDVRNSYHGSTFSESNSRFGVGLIRDNPEIESYLKEQRLVSDTDETITSDALLQGEKTFLNLESESPFDPYNGKMNIVHQLMIEDFRYSKTLDQISETQAKDLIKILDDQGLKDIKDFKQAFDERVMESTKGIEQNLSNVLKQISDLNLDDVNIILNNKGIVASGQFQINENLIQKARNGDFKEWLSNKSGSEAEEELLNSIRSLETIVEVSKGLNSVKSHRNESNTIESETSLKEIYNVVRDSERVLDNLTKTHDNRKEFRYTDVESYLQPLLQNKANRTTKQIIDNLTVEDDDLQNKLLESGILQQVTDETGKKQLYIIDDYSKINVDNDVEKFKDLGRIHGILKTIGKYTVTETATNQNVSKVQIDALKNYLGKDSSDNWVDMLNKPNLEFMYSMVLKDINKQRFNNLVASPSDVDFIIQQSSSAIFGKTGLIKDKNVQGFLLKTIRVPENPALENKYNSKLKTLSESTKGLVQILDENIIINLDTAILLEQKMNDMYSNRDRTEESIVFKELFDNMSNTSLTPVKNKMLEYIRNYGDEAQIKILNLLKNQGVIKKNVDNKLQLTEEPLLIEKFETIDSYINNIGLTPEVVQNEINKRKEINRKYVSDASDVVLNKSMSISEFFNKYQFKTLNPENGITEYKDYSAVDQKEQRELFENQIYWDNDDRIISQNTINGIANRIGFKNKGFNDLNKLQKDSIIQEINQVIFGMKDQIAYKKVEYINDSIEVSDRPEIMQKNPVYDLFNKMGLDIAIFDNNIIKTEIDQGGNFVERTYNILFTQGIPDNSKINQLRNQVQNKLSEQSISPLTGEFLKNKINRSDATLNEVDEVIPSNEIGIKKLDIYNGMDSILIKSTDMEKIVNEFNRFYEEHENNLDVNSKKIIKSIIDNFKNTENKLLYDEENIELAMRYLVLESGFKSDSNQLFYKILSETDPQQVDKYIKRVKLFTTKNFVRPDEKYILSLLQARNKLTTKGDKDRPSQLLKDRLRKKGYNVVIWDDDTESMSKIIRETTDEYYKDNPNVAKMSFDNLITNAHNNTSGFDSISFISKEAMMEYHTLMGHNPNSLNPIKPVISSQGENKNLLYGKTLFIYSPAMEGFFKKNKQVDIVITKSGAKAYDDKFDSDGKIIDTIVKGKTFDDLAEDPKQIVNLNDVIRKVDINSIGLKPQKDSDLLSASESDQDYNYMNLKEIGNAFNEITKELNDNLNKMEQVMFDPFKINAFMKNAMFEGNIPEDAKEGALANLSSMLYYLNLSDYSDPNDYSSNQVQKYLAKEFIDNLYSKRRAITNRIQLDDDNSPKSERYGGQAPIIQSGIKHLGADKKTRLLSTMFDDKGDMIIRGQMLLPYKEKDTILSELSKSGKNIRIVQNEKILSLKDFIKDIKESSDKDKIKLTKEEIEKIDLLEDNLKDFTLEGTHDLIQEISKKMNKRYELGIISRRNPRTRPNDISLLGLKGFLPEELGLAVEINSFDIVNVYEGDYDADKVDYFFAHSDYMFDYIKRNQAFAVQSLDPSSMETPSTFTFQLDKKSSRNSTLSKIGNSIAYKQGIGIVAKASRKINYLQNLGNEDHLFDPTLRERWSEEVKLNNNNEYDGPALLYKSGENEYVSIDTRVLSFYQRYAIEAQYILDGSNELNKNIASNIYEWADKFLFPEYNRSISAKEARAQDFKDIISNGQTAEGNRIRIFQKYKLDENDNKYKASEKLNSADKLIIREFLNQQNKLLTAFGDETYVDGSSRKSSFYDLQMGSKIFRNFHKDIYESLKKQLFYKRKNINASDQDYLDKLIDVKNGAFEPIQDKTNDIYNGEGGGYLDRVAVNIAKREFSESSKEYNLDPSNYENIENWFNDLLSETSTYRDAKSEIDFEKIDNKALDNFTQKIKTDTQNFNSLISSIRRLDKKIDFIQKSSYSIKWKINKIKSLKYVINKLKNEVNDNYNKDISKLSPKKLKFKEYIPIETSDLKRSIMHANTLNAILKNTPKGFKYDNWYETLTDKARKDLKDIKEFNKQTYGGNTLLDELLPYNEKSLITNKNMFEYIKQHRVNSLNAWQLREKFLLEKMNEHGINFLYAYMEPIRNRDAIGVFNNRPVAIPYKESKRYSHGIQVLAGIGNGSKVLTENISENKQSREAVDSILRDIVNSNETYRRFFNKETNLRIYNSEDINSEKFKLMDFDKNTMQRLKDNSDFDWLNKMLPRNELSTINKSVINYYRDYADRIPNRTSEDYQEFLKQLDSMESALASKDYVNPMKYMELRLSLDETFEKLTKQDIYSQEGDDGMPMNIKNNPMFKHNKFLKFKPKQVKSSKKLIGMLKSVNDLQNSLIRSSEQNPMKDTDYERFNTLGQILACK
tara:strand:- start:3188 stop:11848 length:8661 start_codon:yes stop_codon:yes gene_type:complete